MNLVYSIDRCSSVDKNGVKSMPGSIPVLEDLSCENKINKGSQMDHVIKTIN